MREFLLGLIQGLTEFLPISSSGHLTIGQHLLPGAANLEEDVLLNILLHFATLFVVLIYYRREIFDIVQRLVPWNKNVQPASADATEQYRRRLPMLIIVGSIPTGLIGVFLKLNDSVEILFSSLTLVGAALLATGTLLYVANTQRMTGQKVGISYVDALIIGAIQGIAVVPGISRSGSTISAGLLRGIERKTAAEFSFLLSIPAILGAVAMEGKDILHISQSPQVFPYALGMLTAFVSGYVAIIALIRVVIKRQLHWFAWYCWIVGIVVLGYSAW